jgi:hypothetical protein
MSEIQYTMEIFEKFGPLGAFIGLFMLFVLKSTFFKRAYNKISDYFFEVVISNKVKDVSISIRELNESDISNHDIFNYIDFLMYSKIPTIVFLTDYRTFIFRKYLTIYIKSFKKNILTFVLQKDFENMDGPEFNKSLLNLINLIVRDYEYEMVNSNIPDIIIERMKVRNNEILTIKIQLIETVCSSDFYQSDKNRLKLFSILNMLLVLLESTINGSGNVCNGINGALKGMTVTDGSKTYTEPSKSK